MTPQEIYIEVDSQELADELKEICIKYGLPIWEHEIAFIHDYKIEGLNYKPVNVFSYHKRQGFAIYLEFDSKNETTKTQITKEQFIELLDNIKK